MEGSEVKEQKKKKGWHGGRPNRGNTWIHNSIWLKDTVWDKVRYEASASGKSPSAWLLWYVLNFSGIIRDFPKVKEDIGKSRSICVPIEQWLIVKAKADELGYTTSRYVSNVLQS